MIYENVSQAFIHDIGVSQRIVRRRLRNLRVAGSGRVWRPFFEFSRFSRVWSV